MDDVSIDENRKGSLLPNSEIVITGIIKITCMMLPVERRTWERSVSKVTKILGTLVASSQ